MKWIALALLLISPGIVSAQTFPALFAVTGVEKEDVLNIREAPDTSAFAIASLTPDARDIEVIALDESGNWGWINSGEGSGWVAMRFLERQITAGNSLLPRPVTCFGTEPFWSIDIGTGPFAELNLLNERTRRFLGLATISSNNRADHFALMAENNGTEMTAFVRRSICSDGMSDRVYGLGIDLLTRSDDNTRFYSGCCTISPVTQ